MIIFTNHNGRTYKHTATPFADNCRPWANAIITITENGRAFDRHISDRTPKEYYNTLSAVCERCGHKYEIIPD